MAQNRIPTRLPVLQLISLLLGAILAFSACATETRTPDGSAEATAQALAATRLAETVEAASPTPSIAPSSTSTPEPTQTFTPEPTETPTPTATSLGGGGVIMFSSRTFGELGREANILQRLYTVNHDGSGLQLFRHLGSEARWNPDSNLLAYLERQDSEYDMRRSNPLVLHIIDLATNQEISTFELTDYERLMLQMRYFEWLPDGSLVISIRCFGITYIDEFGNLSPNDPNCPSFYRLLPDHATMEKFELNGLNPTDFDVSPDGQNIAFVSYHEGQPNIYLSNLDGSEMVRLTEDIVPFDLAWSPDGNRIAFSTRREIQDGAFSGTGHIFILDVESREVAQITDQERLDANPDWSPDGEMLVYQSADRGDGYLSDLYLISAQGGSPQRLTDNLGPDFAPVWLPAEAAGYLVWEDLNPDLEATPEISFTVDTTAAPLERMVAELANAGYLDSPSGVQRDLPDYSDAWAQLGWYQWEIIEPDLADFVLSANMHWEVASDTADWWSTGCGVIFRENGLDNNYLAAFNLRAFFYFNRYVNGVFSRLGDGGDGGPVSPFEIMDGQRHLLLVAQGGQFYFFINGILSHERADQGLASGGLGFATLSGTNAGFGTRCTWTDIELFELDSRE